MVAKPGRGLRTSVPGERVSPGAMACRLNRAASPGLQLPRLAQIRVNARLPAVAGLAIGGEHVGVETEFHRLFRIRQQRPAAADDLVALTDFCPVEERV